MQNTFKCAHTDMHFFAVSMCSVLQWPPLMWNLFEKWIQTLFVFEDVMGKESATMVIDKEIKTVNESSKKTRAMKAFTMKWPCEQFKKFQNCISPAFTHSVLGIFYYYYYLFFWFFFFFSFCLRRASSITWASQTQIKSMAHWLPQQQTWTHVCLPDSYKKETGIQIGLHCLMEGKRTDHWQSWHKSISDSWKPLFYGLPWFPLVPCLVSVDIGME